MLIPANDREEALELLKRHPGALITGESRGLKIKGFDLGNSPAEYTAEKVAGKTVVMTTSNGTRAVLGAAATGAAPIFVCSFLNLAPVARAYLAGDWAPGAAPGDMAVVCAGSHGEFSLEDFACAGALVNVIMAGKPPSLQLTPDGPAKEAAACFDSYGGDIVSIFNDSPHGRYLKTIGFEDDLYHCARESSLEVVPFYSQGAVTLYLAETRAENATPRGDERCR